MLYAKNQGNHWHVDSGCSKNMKSDKNYFISLKEYNKVDVTFGNDALGKIMHKVIVNYVNGKGKAKNVFFFGKTQEKLVECKSNVLITFLKAIFFFSLVISFHYFHIKIDPMESYHNSTTYAAM